MGIKRGTIAKCSKGHIGVISQSEPITVIRNGKEEKVYVGQHLSSENYGKPWQSKSPVVIGSYLRSLDE